MLQALVIVGATLWLSTRTEAAEPLSASTPVTWRAIVRDTGGALLNLRTAPEVSSSNASRTAAAGDHLEILCGQTGDTVSGEPGRTGVWLKTADNFYVSQLYVAVPGQTRIPRCPQPDLLLIEMPIQSPSGAGTGPTVLAEGASTPPAARADTNECADGACGGLAVAAAATTTVRPPGSAPLRSADGRGGGRSTATGPAEAGSSGQGQAPVVLGEVNNAPTTTSRSAGPTTTRTATRPGAGSQPGEAAPGRAGTVG